MATTVSSNSQEGINGGTSQESLVRRLKFRSHQPGNIAKGCNTEIILNPQFQNQLSDGDIVRICDEHEDDGLNILLRITKQSFRDAVNKDSVSLVDKIVDNKNFLYRSCINHIVQLKKVKPKAVDLLVVNCKDIYLSRNDMWKLKKQMEGDCVYLEKRMCLAQKATANQSVSVSEIWCDGVMVKTGYISANTRLCFRSSTAASHVFIQMSAEMWQYDSYGDLYFEKAVSGFLTELFNKWKADECCHDVTVVMFSRTYYDATCIDDFPLRMRECILYNGKYYEDYYQVVIQNERYEEWGSTLMKLKAYFNQYQKQVLRENERQKDPKIPNAWNSTAAEGNFLEVLNMSLNVYEKYYIDRNFDRLGKTAVIITPGPGVFTVDKELMKITKHRTIESGCAADLICMGEQPLHAVPLLIKRHKVLNSSSQFEYREEIGKYSIPRNWINHSFYTSHNQLRLTASARFIPRVKIASKKPDIDIEHMDVPIDTFCNSDVLSPDRFEDSTYADEYDAGIFKIQSPPPPQPKHQRIRSMTALGTGLNNTRNTAIRENSDEFTDFDLSQAQSGVPVEIPGSREKIADSEGSSDDEPILAGSVDKFESSSLHYYNKIHSTSNNEQINSHAGLNMKKQMTPNRRRWTHAFPYDRQGNVIRPHIVSDSGFYMPLNSHRMITTSGKVHRLSSESRPPSRIHTSSGALSGTDLGPLETSDSTESLEQTDVISPLSYLLTASSAPGYSGPLYGSADNSMSLYRRDLSTTDTRSICPDIEIDTLDWSPLITTGVDWRSLTTPALLPITTDYLPDESLFEKDYEDSVYLLDPLDTGMDLEVFFEELISSRLALGFQLVQLSNDRQENKKSDQKLPPPTTKQNTERQGQRNGQKQTNSQTNIKLKSNKCRLSVGKIFHELTLNENSVTVKVQRSRITTTNKPHQYKYRFSCPDATEYTTSLKVFQHENLENYNWNYLDNYILSRGTPDYDPEKDVASWKYWRARYCLLSAFPQAVKQIKDAIAKQSKQGSSHGVPHCDIFQPINKYVDFFKTCDGFHRFLENVNLFKPMRQRSGNLPHGTVLTTDMDYTTNVDISHIDIKEIHDSMVKLGNGLVFIDHSYNSLPRSCFTSYELSNWLIKNHQSITSLNTAMKVITALYDQKYIDHISRSPEHTTPIFGFYIYFIVEHNDERKISLPKILPGDRVELEFCLPPQDEEALFGVEKTDYKLSNIDVPLISQPDQNFSLSSSTASSASFNSITAELQDDRKKIEWCSIQYPHKFNPYSSFDMEVNWILATGTLLCEMINSWNRKLAPSGERTILPIPIDPFALPEEKNSDPLRGPIYVPLSQLDGIEILNERDTNYFLQYILTRFGFTRLNSQFVHCTGSSFTFIINNGDKVGFQWAWNYMLTKRWWSQSGGDEIFQDTLLADFRRFCSNDENRLKTAFNIWSKTSSSS